jgi:hypothetical protein
MSRWCHRIVIKNASDLPVVDLCIWWTVGYRNPSWIRSKTFGADTDGRAKPRYEHAVGPDETITGVSAAGIGGADRVGAGAW